MHQRGALLTSSDLYLIVKDFIKCMCEKSSPKYLPSCLDKSFCKLKTLRALVKPVGESTKMVQVTWKLTKSRQQTRFFSMLSMDVTVRKGRN